MFPIEVALSWLLHEHPRISGPRSLTTAFLPHSSREILRPKAGLQDDKLQNVQRMNDYHDQNLKGPTALESLHGRGA